MGFVRRGKLEGIRIGRCRTDEDRTSVLRDLALRLAAYSPSASGLSSDSILVVFSPTEEV